MPRNMRSQSAGQKIVARPVWQEHLDLVEQLRKTERGKDICATRKETIERVFDSLPQAAPRGGAACNLWLIASRHTVNPAGEGAVDQSSNSRNTLSLSAPMGRAASAAEGPTLSNCMGGCASVIISPFG